jgi:hypothetical protein
MMPDKLFSLDDHKNIFRSRYARRSPEYTARARRRQELTLLPVGDSFVACQLSDALKGEGIKHSDHLHCQRVNKVESGSLAIVNTPYGLMVRRYFVDVNYIRLEAANPQVPTLCLAPQQVHIIGRPYKLMRDLRDENEGRAEAA